MKFRYTGRGKPIFLALLVVTLVLFSSVQLASGNGSTVASEHLMQRSSIFDGHLGTSVNTSEITHPVLGSFSASLSPTNSVLDIGQSVTFTASPSGTYTYQWYLNGAAVGSNQSTYKFTPSAAGSYSVYVNVTNSSGTEKSNTGSVKVDPAPAVTVSPSSEKIHVGQSINIVSNVTGGTGTFSYIWYLNGTKTSVTSANYAFTPAGNATYYFYVKVNDTGTVNGVPAVSVQSNTAVIEAVFVTYAVVFQETGLPPGTQWYVNLTNGQSFPSIVQVNQFYEPNGTYTFIIASGNKIYSPSPSFGTFTVSGRTVSIVIYFSPVLYHVYFNQSSDSKLPPGTLWYVNITGQPSLSSVTTSIMASIPNGTYNLTISTGDKEYYPTPNFASLRVNGHSITMSVTFSLFTYLVEFTETGLPPNTDWFVKVTGYPPLNISNNSTSSSQTLSFNLPNGSYSYVVQSGVETYGPNPSKGYLNISGADVQVSLRFLRLYQITFVESGLPIIPPGVVWYLNISHALSYESTTDTISFWEPNGTWYYSVSTNDRWYVPLGNVSSGNFTVNGASISPFPASSPLIFNELFNVTIIEQHLPSGTPWYLNLTNGTSYSSVSSIIEFMGINGTYSYYVSTGNKLYRPVSYKDSFIIDGKSIQKAEIFYLVTYPVTFSETGLSNGTIWSVTINNNTRISTNATIVFNLNNGSFQYSIQPIPGFSILNYTGNFSVNGHPILNPVNWTMVVYYLNISQSGLPAGKHWSATIVGNAFNQIAVKDTLNATGSSVSFRVPNGSYNYTINVPFGYTGSHMTGNIKINGHSTSLLIHISPPNFVLIGIVGAIGVSLLAVALFLMIRREHRSVLVRGGPNATQGKHLKLRK